MEAQEAVRYYSELSTTFYNVCAAAYFIGLFTYIANLVMKRAKVRRAATVIVAAGFLAQIIGLSFRWVASGYVEVMSVERAQDMTLEGLSYLVVFTQHPPWSNLYEILVFMSWGVILVFLVSEVKWRIRVAGVGALLIALTAIGLASLTSDVTIKPLVPALQSWWIMIHVISSAVGYASGSIAAVLSLLFLIKARDRITLTSVGGGVMLLSTTIFLVLGRGVQLFSTAEYKVKLLGYLNGVLTEAGAMKDGAFHTWYTPSPGVGPLLLCAIFTSVIAFFAMGGSANIASLFSRFLPPLRPLAARLQEKKAAGSDADGAPTPLMKGFYFVAFGFSTAVVALILINANVLTDLDLGENAKLLTHGAPPPWRLHIRSNQWDLALFAIVWGIQAFVGACMLFPQKARALLPDANRLDRAAYYTVLVAFALVAVVLVTGALWAHYAWGRYWAWDPKETGAFVIWITYAVYLHARVTYGWVGVPSAVIAALGFFVIIGGFLGVNLGWFADGLHSYGSS